MAGDSEIVELVELTVHNDQPHHCVVVFDHTTATYGVSVENAARHRLAKFEGLSPKEFLQCVRGNSPVQAVTPLKEPYPYEP